MAAAQTTCMLMKMHRLPPTLQGVLLHWVFLLEIDALVDVVIDDSAAIG